MNNRRRTIRRRKRKVPNATHGRTELNRVAKRISFTEFLTLLRLLTKKTFINGNKRVVTFLKLPFKTFQGRCSAIKALVFGSGLYHTATTLLPVLNDRLRTHRYPFIPLFNT